jgi:hypothetical protein
MKLKILNRFKLPENAFFLADRSLILNNGRLISFIYPEKGLSVLTIFNNQIDIFFLDEKPFSRYHTYVIIPYNNTQFAILHDLESLHVYNEDFSTDFIIKIKNGKILEEFNTYNQEPRLSGVSSIGEYDNLLPVILSHPQMTQNNQYLAFLNIDKDHKTAYWNSILNLPERDYPMDRFGGIMPLGFSKEPPIIGHIMIDNKKLFVSVEGSDTMSLNRYGMDFYTLAEIDINGSIVNRIYEQKGLKLGTKKHGIQGKFASSKDFIILTPVFSNDDWKGKQKLYSLNGLDLIDVEMPKGTKKSRIIDHKDGVFWLTDYCNEILTCMEED